MAKNELLPFANGEDANVLPTNQWEALTDILENGFQSGVARSEQVNRVLAQGAVASYVLGQLIVDELNQDATLDKDTLYQRLVSALESKAKDVCLPLSGGKIMGAITNPSDGAFSWTSGEYKCTMLLAGEWGTSAGLSLRSKDATSETGFFNLLAADSTQSKLLQGRPDGTLQWGGNNVITSAGGTFVNKITFSSNRAIDSTNSGGLFIVAEKDKDSRNTGSIAVFPVGHSEANRKGAFELGCSDGTNQKKLIGHYSNGLKWDGNDVATISLNGNTFIRYSDGTQICWGRIDVQANQSSATQTFPCAFANTDYAITITTLDDNVTSYPFNIGTRGTGSFTAWCRSTGAFDRAATWIAIGRWW